MKVIQVVPSIGKEAAGPSYSVPGLCRGLHLNNVEVELHFRKLNNTPKSNYKLVEYPWYSFLRNLGYCPEMFRGLKHACKTSEIIHTNGLWMLPHIYPAWAINGTTCKFVLSPRGSFALWSLKKGWLKKKLFGWLFQNKVLRRVDMFHATSEKEYKEIRALGYKQPIAIVPIGMDVPVFADKTSKSGLVDWGISGLESPKGAVASKSAAIASPNEKQGTNNGQRETNNESDSVASPPTANSEQLTANKRLKRLVFFGRIHKVKAVDHLVRSWGALHTTLPNWELVIAGPDCGAQGELEAIIVEHKIPRVRFVGEINGAAKYDFLTEADIYVLPSHTENFGVTVAEALACGTPVIASQGTPWQGLETEKCGKWVSIGVDPLVAALRELISLTDDERAAMGARGREWIMRDFSWDGIGAKMKAAYAWLLGQGEKPDFVRIN